MSGSSADLLQLVAVLVVAVPLAALWAFALADVLLRADWEFPPSPMGPNARLFWGVFVLLFNAVGAIVYYVNVMRPRPRQRR